MTKRETSAQAARTLITFLAGVVLGVLMMVQIVPASSLVEIEELGNAPTGALETIAPNDRASTADDPLEPAETVTILEGGTTGGTSEPRSTTGGETGPDEGRCAPDPDNGATDKGVTADRIAMATTVVESGIGSAFLGEVRFAMDAVVNKVNRAGGICGRLLDVTYRDDGWEPARGATFLNNFFNGDYFAIPIGPSSEGLNVVIENGDVDRAGIPVVGTDGLTLTQYVTAEGAAQPWVWPVAVATVSSARIMARDAHERGATNFSIVFDSNYKFGEEAALAFNAEVKRLTGSDVAGFDPQASSCDQSFCGITAGRSSYSQEVQKFQEGDFVALFLEPDTALKWMNDSNAPSAIDADIPYGFGAAQPLFTRQFSENCKAKCHGMRVWTGFKPFQEHYRSDPRVQEWVNDLQSTNPSADPNNQFSLGAYIGMELLVEALTEVGPNLTRAALRDTINSMEFTSGLTLTDPLRFSPDNRYVATSMQWWEIQYRGTFAGWKAGDVVADPQFGG